MPSGGINVIDLSLSNLPNLTHWWNLISSICIPRSYLVGLAAEFLIRSLSLIPNLHSGIPLKEVLTRTWPCTSALRTVPLFDMSTFTFSTISMNTSFFLYLIPSALHEIAPVAWIVIYLSFYISYTNIIIENYSITFRFGLVCFPYVMYILRRSGSRICGNPWSITSSKSS